MPLKAVILLEEKSHQSDCDCGFCRYCPEAAIHVCWVAKVVLVDGGRKISEHCAPSRAIAQHFAYRDIQDRGLELVLKN